MSDHNYWSKLLNHRLDRRRALAATAGLATGAALLAACGGSASDENKSGLVGQAADSTEHAVRGGTWRVSRSPTGTLDPTINAGLGSFGYITPVYSQLLKYGKRAGTLPTPDMIKGDAATSWELSPEGTQLTLKLRSDHKFDPRPPTNSRAMTSADVMWSWQRTTARSPLVGEILNKGNPAGPIESMSAPDAATIVVKLAFPYASLPEALAYYYFHILPVEAEDKFNPASEARGSGPFMITSYSPDGSTEFKRRDDWYENNRPFLDGIVTTNISEPAAALAQFEAGNLWTLDTVPQDQVLRVKQDHPEMLLTRFAFESGSPSQNSNLIFSTREDSIFRDVRLRQASMYLYDAEAYMEAFFNVPGFTRAGLPYETFRNSHLAVQGQNWMDPRNKNFGVNAKYFEYRPEEAKKLIAATGLGTPEFEFISWASPGAKFQRTAEVLTDMWTQGGFKVTQSPKPTQQWMDFKRKGPPSYNGVFQGSAHGYNDDSMLATKYTAEGKERVTDKPIPGVSDMIVKIQRELDTTKRNAMIKQLQSDVLPPLMLDFTADFQQRVYGVHWPWMRNYQTFLVPGFTNDTSSARPYTEYWFDASKKPG